MKKLKLLFDEWKLLKRAKQKKKRKRKKENKWKNRVDELFDITHIDANKIITYEKDKEFLRQ